MPFIVRPSCVLSVQQVSVRTRELGWRGVEGIARVHSAGRSYPLTHRSTTARLIWARRSKLPWHAVPAKYGQLETQQRDAITLQHPLHCV
ncbi:hypothetical protein AOLI_G00073730 [Acnodon oligacanthus]